MPSGVRPGLRPPGGARSEDGFALLVVLWVMVGLAALGLIVSLAGREAVAAAQNRIDLTRAAWRAEDCLERARAVIGEALLMEASGGSGGGVRPWNILDRIVPTAPPVAAAGCEISMRAAGEVIDLNAADEELLRRLLLARRIPPARVDTLVHSLLDWRDADDTPRLHGAERAWYRAARRHLPRNGALADVRELERVRGFEGIGHLDGLLGAEPGRVALNHAPALVLSALPGFTEETVARILEQRLRGRAVEDLLALSGELSPDSREALLARYPDLVRITTAIPDAWLVTSRAREGTPPVTAVLEVRLVRAGTRAAMVRRRTWIS